MNGQDRDAILEFANKIGALTAGQDGIVKAIESLERKIDKRDEICEKLRSECAAVKSLPSVYGKLKVLSDRISKIELNATIQKMTWRMMAKIIGATTLAATALREILKVFGH